ncbi:cellulose biosynthesis cyclic di-GMP-binding regulatory protein BcsB [Desulfosoma caldarium]|uniref:Cyclic di-GMP-binding protein n=1 Tax=Desulfosoma caldarium TaxID=610254 RepID=A0A3N1US29_9BACT|nr:cellulose biosynthesis cyclic di-GMP-binding regulatory protein BcsB [Desulfosoma caldarium]ROQ89896.1 cellulose synthase subunit [Desulfosoma caldarium]
MDARIQETAKGFLRRATWVLALALFCPFMTQTAWAVAEPEPMRFRVPLPQLVPVSVHKLQGAYSGFDVSLPVPERWRVHDAVLTFSYVNSTALLRQNSRLIVELNGHPLAQVVLEPQAPEGKVSVRLPPDLLTPGYNNLSFKVTQHYVLNCEDATAPELWTTLKLDEAYLDWTVSLKPVPLQLSALPTVVFDPVNPRPERVHIVVASTSLDDARRAMLAASGVALRFAYRPVEFSVSDTLKPGCDNLVVGSPDFLFQLLGASAPNPEGAYLEVRSMPTSPAETGDVEPTVDSTHALILVSGPDEAALTKALQALAFVSFPFPDTPMTVVHDVVPPSVSPYEARGMLQLDRTYTFQDLGFSSVTFQGYRPAPSILRFRLPSDILIKPHKYAALSLHIAYSAGMRKDSVLALFLNGKFFSSIPLNEKAGAHYQGYRISFPTYLLRPGENELAFHPVLTPLITGECTLIQTNHLLLTVFDDSTFHVPGISHWAELPDLELFFKDGFPFARHPDGREAALWIPRGDFASVEAAINLVALMSQKVGYPPLGLQVWDRLPQNPAVNVLAVAPLNALPGKLLESAPYQLVSPVGAAYPVPSPPASIASQQDGWINERLRRLLGRTTPIQETSQGRLALTKQTGGLSPHRAALMEYRLPGTSDRTLLVLTAQDASVMARAARSLWEFETQGACRGDLALLSWDGSKTRVDSLRVSTPYRVGTLTPLTRLDFFVYRYPWAFALSVLVALALVSYLVYLMLKRIRRRRLSAS